MADGSVAADRAAEVSAGFARYRGKRVLVTGHTGFKGGWLALWLKELGAEVTGFALAPDTEPALFRAIELEGDVTHRLGDLRDRASVRKVIDEARPDAIFHLAAQPLVRRSYREPVETFATNVMGTVHVLEAVRERGQACAVVIVSSDKCYENEGSGTARVEGDPLGGHDPYSASKGACELVVQAYRQSYFAPEKLAQHGVALASGRAGNVIGGGDWAEDRIVADAVRAFGKGEALTVRNPGSTRPFQHVIEPLAGYLTLGARLLEGGARAQAASRGWNFAPNCSATVRELVTSLAQAWGEGARFEERPVPGEPHEAKALVLDASAAERELFWRSKWELAEAARRTALWAHAHRAGEDAQRLRARFFADVADWRQAHG
ncbi:MAG: CDP-glucose 4,6-dehydratase [Deltaproteobacteria bacterium]|nr:CDP-glucose 4,6-dehydratase [Deltaproteobacteria bacterium]